jgi:hypothetical protein
VKIRHGGFVQVVAARRLVDMRGCGREACTEVTCGARRMAA